MLLKALQHFQKILPILKKEEQKLCGESHVFERCGSNAEQCTLLCAYWQYPCTNSPAGFNSIEHCSTRWVILAALIGRNIPLSFSISPSMRLQLICSFKTTVFFSLATSSPADSSMRKISDRYYCFCPSLHKAAAKQCWSKIQLCKYCRVQSEIWTHQIWIQICLDPGWVVSGLICAQVLRPAVRSPLWETALQELYCIGFFVDSAVQ